MSCGHSLAPRSARSGCGWRCAAEHGKWWLGVVAWYWGDRSAVTCGALWNKIPDDYKRAFCYSDFWEAYQKVLPEDQHQACGKGEGQTNHVERFNLTLRQRIGRLTRKTLSFSKSVLMHLISIRLFLVQYNQDKAKRYNSLNTSR